MSGFNKGEFERNLKRTVEKAANDRIRTVASQLQTELRRLTQTQKGKPVDSVKPLVRSTFKRNGWDITDPELTKYAEAVSSGVHIDVKPQNLRL